MIYSAAKEDLATPHPKTGCHATPPTTHDSNTPETSIDNKTPYDTNPHCQAQPAECYNSARPTQYESLLIFYEL